MRKIDVRSRLKKAMDNLETMIAIDIVTSFAPGLIDDEQAKEASTMLKGEALIQLQQIDREDWGE